MKLINTVFKLTLKLYLSTPPPPSFNRYKRLINVEILANLGTNFSNLLPFLAPCTYYVFLETFHIL